MVWGWTRANGMGDWNPLDSKLESNLSWITEINELFHDILIYWDALVRTYLGLGTLFGQTKLGPTSEQGLKHFYRS